jgi:hypothetical protein
LHAGPKTTNSPSNKTMTKLGFCIAATPYLKFLLSSLRTGTLVYPSFLARAPGEHVNSTHALRAPSCLL